MSPALVESKGKSRVINANETKNIFGLRVTVNNERGRDWASIVMPDNAVMSSLSDDDCCSLRIPGVHRTNVKRLDVHFGHVTINVNGQEHRVVILDKDRSEFTKEKFDALVEARGRG